MTPALRRLAALSAALAPEAAERWLLLVSRDGPAAASLAAELARGGREARVAAVAAAFAGDEPPPRTVPVHALLQRLEREEREGRLHSR
ncbi:hypothetical protein [Anaeromyxobacter diazotrophicus]|uniref:Uncharacterized protein n=1 Tax=Anaeromyxobacter diazotrophicus TaxID=2590199 RepID=A0A7I9VHF6_9BACT|nr:hypothetical protein [Anaeromyxobacter diazotrophicus]GEJ55570.1 hypothetical protein AMYX_03110 [Anaeromyxobacter diazotrophicus]